MICFGRSSYFRFNHPAEAQHLKQEYFDIYSETYSTSDLFSKKEPLYANEEMSNSSATSTTEGSLSIPFYDNVSEIRASHDKKSANGDSQSTICDSSSLLSSDPDHTLSRYHGTCSPVRPLSPFHSDFVVFPDGSRRAIINDQFFDGDCMTSSDLFDEKASHIPRPLSPSIEGLTVDNWSGYDNVLELKEAMKKQEVGKERTPEPKNFKSESLFSAVPLVNCNDKFSPIGVFISDAMLPAPKIEHDPFEKQASELPDKRKVTFSIKEAVNTSPTVNNVPPLDAFSKPPSGKHAIDQFKKTENRKEKKFVWSKRNTCPTAESEVPIKSSFFKSLIRSRSPSPSSKRSPSPTQPLNTDVARRLSEPLKKSFKNPDMSLKEKFMGMQSSRIDSSSSDEESLNSKSSVRISSVSSTCPDQPDLPNKPPDYPAHAVTISTFNTTDDEKFNTHLQAEHEIICSPLKMDPKSCNENVSLDNYKGEKLFSRDTVTTSIAVPGVATYQTSNSRNNLIGSLCDIKPSAEVKSRSNRKQKNDVPIYDRVYDGAKRTGKASSNLDQAITENRLSENVIEFIDRIVSEEKGFNKQSNNISGNMLPPFVNKTKQVQTGCDSNSLTNMTNLVKETNPQIVHMNKTTAVMKSQDHPSMESYRGTQSTSSPAVNAVKPMSGSDKAQHSSVKTLKMSDDLHRIRDDKVTENVKRRFGHVDFENDLSLCKTTNSDASGNRSPSPTKMFASSSGNDRLFQDEVVSSKPPLCESNKSVDEETSALFGVRRGVLRRMKLLKHKIEEIEEKERNIENLITRNSMSIDVLEKKQISEKDIKEFFSNATSVLDNLEEEGKRVEHQFMEANEYLTRIDKTIGDIEKRKKQNGNNNNINNRNNNNNNNGKVDEILTSSTAHGYSSKNANHDLMFQRSSEPSTTLDVKISSGSSDNSSISGSALLLDRSVRKTKGSSGSLNPTDNNVTVFMPRNSTCRPLTRYFPVTDSSFDLKCYIEMSGHNLDMCKTVFVESYRCCGYLSKMGRKWKKWHKRWFVFERTKRHLACYLHEPLKQHQQPRSVCYFQSIRDVFADHLHMVKSPNPDFTFCVKLVDKNLFLMASSADAMRIWIDVLFTGAEAYQDVS